MNKTELIETMDLAIEALTVNRETVTPELLDKLDQLVAQVCGTPNIAMGICGLTRLTMDDLIRVIDGVRKFVAIERRMLEAGTDQKVVKSLENLKGRPMILGLIATVV